MLSRNKGNRIIYLFHDSHYLDMQIPYRYTCTNAKQFDVSSIWRFWISMHNHVYCFIPYNYNAFSSSTSKSITQKRKFDSKIACLCQSIKINNNKHVYRQSQVAKANRQWSQVTHHRNGLLSSSFCLIIDSSIRLWVGIQSVGDLVSQTPQLRILYSAEEDNLSHSDWKSLACACQSIKINNNKH